MIPDVKEHFIKNYFSAQQPDKSISERFEAAKGQFEQKLGFKLPFEQRTFERKLYGK